MVPSLPQSMCSSLSTSRSLPQTCTVVSAAPQFDSSNTHSCSILNAPPSLQVLWGARENALAQSESTLQSSRWGWEHLGVLRSNGEGYQSVWEGCVWLPDWITFCWCPAVALIILQVGALVGTLDIRPVLGALIISKCWLRVAGSTPGMLSALYPGVLAVTCLGIHIIVFWIHLTFHLQVCGLTPLHVSLLTNVQLQFSAGKCTPWCFLPAYLVWSSAFCTSWLRPWLIHSGFFGCHIG